MVPSGMPGPKDRDGWGAKNKGGEGDEESRIRPKNYQARIDAAEKGPLHKHHCLSHTFSSQIFHPEVERLCVFVRACARSQLAFALECVKILVCARTNKLEAVRIQDYNQWDKFVHKDLDKILDDFDENDRQEQEETHR
jgi:hypothetical protein